MFSYNIKQRQTFYWEKNLYMTLKTLKRLRTIFLIFLQPSLFSLTCTNKRVRLNYQTSSCLEKKICSWSSMRLILWTFVFTRAALALCLGHVMWPLFISTFWKSQQLLIIQRTDTIVTCDFFLCVVSVCFHQLYHSVNQQKWSEKATVIAD